MLERDGGFAELDLAEYRRVYACSNAGGRPSLEAEPGFCFLFRNGMIANTSGSSTIFEFIGIQN
jgi:hypothetical protein